MARHKRTHPCNLAPSPCPAPGPPPPRPDLSNLVNEAALLAAQQDATAITAPMIDYAYDKVRRAATPLPD